MSGVVWDAGHAVPKKAWRKAVGCGDMRDRFPCNLCMASRPSQCRSGLSTAEIEATRDFINGYGWDAARRLANQDTPA